MIYTLAAAGKLPDLNGKVLFIEDIDEYLYHIDRMLRAIEISGALRGISALIVGTMTDMKDHEIPFGWTMKEIISDVFKNYAFPILWGLHSGHDQKNFSLKLGMSIKFDGETLTQH
jgi:muramoyltetrapeptide carboxypeptidase